MKREHIRNYRSQDAALAAPKLGFGSSCLAPYAPYRQRTAPPTGSDSLTQDARSHPGATQGAPRTSHTFSTVRQQASSNKRRSKASKQAGSVWTVWTRATDISSLRIFHSSPVITLHHSTTRHLAPPTLCQTVPSPEPRTSGRWTGTTINTAPFSATARTPVRPARYSSHRPSAQGRPDAQRYRCVTSISFLLTYSRACARTPYSRSSS